MVKEKQDAYTALIDSRTDEEIRVKRAECKAGKKIAKKAINVVKNNAFNRLYRILKTKEGERDVFGLAWSWEKKKLEIWVA